MNVRLFSCCRSLSCIIFSHTRFFSHTNKPTFSLPLVFARTCVLSFPPTPLCSKSLALTDWCCFYYSIRNSLVALLEALFARYAYTFLYTYILSLSPSLAVLSLSPSLSRFLSLAYRLSLSLLLSISSSLHHIQQNPLIQLRRWYSCMACACCMCLAKQWDAWTTNSTSSTCVWQRHIFVELTAAICWMQPPLWECRL